MESLRSIKVQSQVYNISKHDSTPLMPIRSDALKNLSKSSQATMNIAQMNVANNDARSIIEKLMHSGNPPLLHRGSSSTGRDVLLDAEEKIFQQVVKLALEVAELKDNIRSENQDILKMRAEYPEVAEQLEYFGYSRRITPEELGAVVGENQQLEKEIMALQLKDEDKFEQIMRQELDKNLKLTEEQKEKKKQMRSEDSISNQNEKKGIMQANQELREAIKKLVTVRKAKILEKYPELARLRQENEKLRIATVRNLKPERDSASLIKEEVELQKYLQEEEKQKILFKEDLLAYKKDCNKIKAENDYLKMEMQRRGLLLDVDAKSQRTLSNTLPQGGIQNRSRRESIPAFKFNEYQSLIQKMQNVNS